MCNLYRMTRANAEVAHWFGAAVGEVGNAAAARFISAIQGIAKGELRSMVWGFPLVLKGKSSQPLKLKPVNNARADKLDGFLWRYVAECTIACQ